MNDDRAGGTSRSRIKAWDGKGVHADFAATSKTRSWTIGYRSLEKDRVSAQASITGALPAGLRGAFFRNGPACHERGGQRYGHRWDGDGMVQRFELSDGGVSHVGQYVHTHKYLTESAQGRLLTSGFGTHVPGSNPGDGDIDSANAANISVLHFAGELLALWEPGSAYRIDPDTLATLGVKTWDPALAGRPFSAHPRIEADGTLWNFGIDPLLDELTLYHVSSQGQVLRSQVIKVDRLPPTHDFAVTAQHLVFLFPPLLLDKDRLRSGSSFAEACHWTPALGMRVLTIAKADWSLRWYELPPGCVFHVANAWEDEQGVIRLHYMRSAGPMSLMAGWSVMRGQYRHFEGPHLATVRLDPIAGTATQETLGDEEREFPVVEAVDVGRRHRRVLCLERSADRRPDLPGFDAVAMVDVENGNSQRFSYGDEWLVEEHVLARAHDEERSRWIVGTALDLRSSVTVLSAFDANRLADGPVVQARLPYAMPLGLHGTYVPAAR